MAQRFEVFVDDSYMYSGVLGPRHRWQTITMAGKDGAVVLRGEHGFSEKVNYIPFRQLFGKARTTRRFRIFSGEKVVGDMALLNQGLYKSFYRIALSDGGELQCYSREKGSFGYVSVYQEERQIALLEIYLTTVDYKYNYKVYLLEECTDLRDILVFFVLYYANWNYAQRFHMSKESVHVKAWTFSRYNQKYDPAWREKHFPQENFFGKTSLFE